jgi:hypothetical protein
MERQYIGARYVPKFAEPVEWNKALSYEAMTIVTYLGNSFTSKKPVPAGIEIGDNEYWVNTGNYNAQVEEYRQSVIRLENNLSAINATNPPSGYASMSVDSADNSAALQALVDNFECVFIPAGNYTLANTITITNNTKIIGNGTLVRASGNRYGDILHVTGCTLLISGITINDNGSTLPIFTSADFDILDKRYVCIKVDNNAKIDVNWCTFNDVYTRAVDCYNAGGISVCNNAINTTIRNQGYVGEFIHILTCYCPCVIEGNSMACPDYNNPALGMCGVFVSGYNGGGRISNNYMRTVGRNLDYGHRLLPIDFYLNVNNMTVENNDITTAHGFMRINGCTNISVRHNTVEKPGDYEDTTRGDPFIWIYSNTDYNSSDIEVSYNNFSIINGRAIVTVAGDVGNSIVDGNVFTFPETGNPTVGVLNLIENAKNFTFSNNIVKQLGTVGGNLLNFLSAAEDIKIAGNTIENIVGFSAGDFVANGFVVANNVIAPLIPDPFGVGTWDNTLFYGNNFKNCNVKVSGTNTLLFGNVVGASYLFLGTAKAVNNIKGNALYPA